MLEVFSYYLIFPFFFSLWFFLPFYLVVGYPFPKTRKADIWKLEGRWIQSNFISSNQVVFIFPKQRLQSHEDPWGESEYEISNSQHFSIWNFSLRNFTYPFYKTKRRTVFGLKFYFNLKWKLWVCLIFVWVFFWYNMHEVSYYLLAWS